MNDAERRIVVVNDGSDQRRLVVERGQASIVVRGADQRIQVAVGGGGGGGGSGNALLGIPVIFSEISAGDVLQFNGSAIVNTNQTVLTDGGNF